MSRGSILIVFGLAFVALLGIFYISTFIDLADKLFGGAATIGHAAALLLFRDAAVRLLHHPAGGARRHAGDRRPADEEQRAHRHAGLRHQPVPRRLPLLVFASCCSGVLFEMQEHVLAESNREAARLNAIIRGFPVPTFGVLNRQWILGRNGDIYHYQFFDPRSDQFTGCRSVPARPECLAAEEA